MADPSYVRLANRLQKGILADVHGSGWSISGQDVVEFPDSDDKEAVKFVRAALKNGKLEPASKAEYEEVQDSDPEDVEEEERSSMSSPSPSKSSNPKKTKAKSKKAKSTKKKAASEDSEDDDDSSGESE